MPWPINRVQFPHGYQPDQLKRLLAAYIAHDNFSGKNRTVREVVSEFRGLSGSAKQAKVLETAGLSRMSLSDLVSNGHLDEKRIVKLLEAMQEHSQPVKPAALGIIGESHLCRRFQAAGCAMDSFNYRRVAGTTEDGLPFVIEAAFAVDQRGVTGDEDAPPRHLITGINWSPAILNPFRELSGSQSLEGILTEQRAGCDEPIVVLLHLACPRVVYTDHGKSAVVIDPELGEKIIGLVERVTAKWTKQRKAEERETARRARRAQAWIRADRVTIKDAASEVMEEAYLHASSNGTLPASARQIMYAARGAIQEQTGKSLDDAYFTQTLLPNYILEHPEQTAPWDVVFDARGHFTEPHTGMSVPLGTVDVREYLEGVASHAVTSLNVSTDARDYPCRPIRRDHFHREGRFYAPL